MSSREMTPKVAIYNTPIARDYRKANPRVGLGPVSIPPRPPSPEAEIQAIERRFTEDCFIYDKIIEGYSYSAIGVIASQVFNRKISTATIAGKVARWREVEAQKLKTECGK